MTGRLTSEKVLRTILEEEPSQAFLEATRDGLPADVLAQVVRGLRQTAALPEGLTGVVTAPHWGVMDVCGTG